MIHVGHQRLSRAETKRRQRGASLVEAMIGFLVVAVGMLATAQWQNRLRLATDLARQQSEAVRVAQQDIESLRAFATRDHSATLPSFADIESTAAHTLDAAAGANIAFTLTREVMAVGQPALKGLAVQVEWPDARGVKRTLRLDTLQAGQAPALALALSQAPAGRDAGPLLGRHAAIPREALALGDGRSVYKPVSDGSEAWLLDDRSGHIRARCDGVPTTKATRQLSIADLSTCTPTDAVLLSGRARFAPTTPAGNVDATTARDAPLPMGLSLSTSGAAAAPICRGEAVKLVTAGAGDHPRALAVAASATPASQGLLAWTDLGDRHWRYHCAVTLSPAPAPVSGNPPPAPQWSGRLQFTPSGWTLGTVAGARRICRYSADTDGSGQVDRPAENTDSFSGVEDALVEQNFLVIDGTQPCPTRTPATLAGGAVPWSDANPATVPHQP